MNQYTPKEIEKLCRLASLTEKEKTVFYLTCEDVKQLAIGKQLKVSAAMIRLHMHRIYQKCDIAPQSGPRSMEKELIRQYGRFAVLVKENRLPVEDLPCEGIDLTPKHYQPNSPKRHLKEPKEKKQKEKKQRTPQTKAAPLVFPVPSEAAPTSSDSPATPAIPMDQGKEDQPQIEQSCPGRHPKRAHLWRKPPKKQDDRVSLDLERQPSQPGMDPSAIAEEPKPSWETEIELQRSQMTSIQGGKPVEPLPPVPEYHLSPPPNESDDSCATLLVLTLMLIGFLFILIHAAPAYWVAQFPWLQQVLQP